MGMVVAEGIVCTSQHSCESFINQVQFVRHAGVTVKKFAHLLLLTYGEVSSTTELHLSVCCMHCRKLDTCLNTKSLRKFVGRGPLIDFRSERIRKIWRQHVV